MNCGKCGGDSRVVDSRPAEKAGITEALRSALAGTPFHYRRRECQSCQHRWTTVEVSAMDLWSLVRSAREAGRAVEVLPERVRQLVLLLAEEVSGTAR